MAIYDIHGNILSDGYFVDGENLNNAYDINGEVIFTKGIETTLDDERTDLTMVWHDEFTILNKDLWTYELGHIRNNELQYYTNNEKNVYINENGLVLKAIKDNPNSNFAWSSGSINTRNKYAFYRGLVEAKCRHVCIKGKFGAFWAMNDTYYFPYDGSSYRGLVWPKSAEVDIIEWMCSSSSQYMQGNLYYWNDSTSSKGTLTTGNIMPNIDDDWHIYGWERTDDKYNFYFDRKLVGSLNISSLTGTGASGANNPSFMMFDMAMGAAGGTPDSALTEAELEVAWIRAYLPSGVTEPESIDFSFDVGDSVSLSVGEDVMVLPIWNTKNGVNYGLYWESSDESIAKVFGGRIYGLAVGTVSITASCADGAVHTLTVTIA